MKKIAAALTIMIVLILTSCSGSEKVRPEERSQTPEKSGTVITYISPVRPGDPDDTPVSTDNAETAEPDETPFETPEETPDEAETGLPTAGETLTPPPSEEPEETLTLSPEPTKTPTEKPTASPSPEPTEAPTEKPVVTPRVRPTATPAPSPTPDPDATPEPEPADPYAYIERVTSPVDFNGNGIDDYTDFLIGARKDAENHPRYDASYQANGYPPDDVGVCADVIWRSFREAGYSLRYMVDRDIRQNKWRYPMIDSGKEKRDSKIDFRRVRNLRIFFDEYAIKLTNDIDEIEEWQPGDIVIFYNNTHIGIVSDKRNELGRPYIIHNGGQAEREQDYLGGDHTVAAHYRFDASRVPEEMLIPWEG
ncbi:MAG: DUF1287 domain-containing protein [Clostridia bacterium]|nr:DUF1287 domain-containing protein [Clostridia bacterium]